MKAVLIALVLAACQRAQPLAPTPEPTPTVVAPAPKAAATILAVSRAGERLGTIKIVRGELGTLEISGAIAAKWLIDAWAEVKQHEDVRVHWMVPASDGAPHKMEETVFKPTDIDYAVGVQSYLLEKDFEVEIIAAAPSGRSS